MESRKLGEAQHVSFKFEKLIPVEGPMWMLKNFDDRWNDVRKREQMFEILETLENEEWMLSVSSHIIGIGYK